MGCHELLPPLYFSWLFSFTSTNSINCCIIPGFPSKPSFVIFSRCYLNISSEKRSRFFALLYSPRLCSCFRRPHMTPIFPFSHAIPHSSAFWSHHCSSHSFTWILFSSPVSSPLSLQSNSDHIHLLPFFLLRFSF